MDVCRAKGLEVLMQTTIMDMNYDELPELVDFARRRGAWSFNLYFLVQTGRGHQMNDLSPQRTHAALAQMVDLQEDFKPMLVRSKCAPQYKQIAYAAGRGGLESGGCMAGVDYARITPNGDVTPCPYMEVVAGNVLDSSFADIWSTSPVLSDLRDTARLKGRCGSCEFNELCGGCRCRAYSAFGDYLQEDPACMERIRRKPRQPHPDLLHPRKSAARRPGIRPPFRNPAHHRRGDGRGASRQRPTRGFWRIAGLWATARP
jgi:radical SAM protein with 4Fe4S-binding SPASM domain